MVLFNEHNLGQKARDTVPLMSVDEMMRQENLTQTYGGWLQRVNFISHGADMAL
jgi:hypothetical protein